MREEDEDDAKLLTFYIAFGSFQMFAFETTLPTFDADYRIDVYIHMDNSIHIGYIEYP